MQSISQCIALLALISIHIPCISAEAQRGDSTATIHNDVSSIGFGTTQSPIAGSHAQSAHQKTQHAPEGFELVDRALLALQKIDLGHKINAQKKSGFIGTALYYAKDLIPRLSISGPSEEHDSGSKRDVLESFAKLRESVSWLEQAAKLDNPDAIYLLAELNFYGNFSHPRNYAQAFQRYEQLSSLDGNSSAQYMMGLMYATGIGNAVERDQAKALLYHTFAAQSGHTKSQMTVAYRHHTGIGTVKDCDQASRYYKNVADKAVQWSRSGPPGGRAWVQDSYRIADESGGVYGEGASVASAGNNAAKGGPNSDAHAALDDILEYLDLMSGKGDFKATFSLGRINYDGQKDLPRNLKAARRYFQIVVSQYWKQNGKTVDTSDKPGLDDIACKAAGYLGRMYLRGEGVHQDFKKATAWFQRGLLTGDAGSQHGLGIMYLRGLGVPINTQKAFDYFRAAAEQGYAPAQVQVGALHLDQGTPNDVQVAYRYFELAARFGTIEAYYYLAEMIDQAVGRDRSCGLATAYYKLVAEKAEPLVSSFAEANEAYKNADFDLAFVGYLMAAEQGYEKGQANVAYMLDEQNSALPLGRLLPPPINAIIEKPRSPLLHNARLALIYWTRSAKQANTDSMVKMGDYYLDGIGTEKDLEKAAACYTSATSEHQRSAQALYNLGWMHENGVGLTKDYHLAKRYYDHALETNEEAYLPVTLSLLKLRAKSAWNTFTHGKINSIHEEPVSDKQWSVKEWIRNFIQDGAQQFYEDFDDDLYPTESLASHNDEQGIYDELDDGILETVLIMVLAAALVWLIYYRQARQLVHRRAEADRLRRAGVPVPAVPANEGLFPVPGDPAALDWAAGGIGH